MSVSQSNEEPPHVEHGERLVFDATLLQLYRSALEPVA